MTTGEKIIERADLEYRAGSSDKEYHLQLIEDGAGLCRVDFQYGRRGSTLNTGTKIADVGLATAQKTYNKIKNEKTGKGYKVMVSGTQPVMVGAVTAKLTTVSAAEESNSGKPLLRRKLVLEDLDLIIPQLCNPIEESEVPQFLKDDRYGMQEKKNGKNFILRKSAQGSYASNKKGGACGCPQSFYDGLSEIEQVIVNGEGIWDTLYAFDLLELERKDLRGLTYRERHEKLSGMRIRPGVEIVPLAIGYAEKKKLYDRLMAENKEGVVFKLLDSVYEPGRPASGGSFLKFKFYAELSARVCEGRPGKNSIGLELLDEKGVWKFRGFCTVTSKQKQEAMVGSVAEIFYLYVSGQDGHLYQPAFKEIRDDVDLSECTEKQIKFKPEDD